MFMFGSVAEGDSDELEYEVSLELGIERGDGNDGEYAEIDRFRE